MKTITESIKVSKSTLNKVRKYVKKTKQSIGGFYDLAAQEKIQRESSIELAIKNELPNQ